MKKIIHFDDDEFLAELYGLILIKEGFDYKNLSRTPASKNELLDLIISENPDLIIMGLLQPEMDGFKATEALKFDERTKNIPIFGLDNWNQEDEIDKLKRLGMDRYYINNQWTPSEFLEEIEIFLNNNK